jgi:hypothetical protein
MEKIKVTAFVSLSSCTCVYGTFLDQVQKILTPYIESVQFEVKDGAGPEGDKWEVFCNSLVIEHPSLASGTFPGIKFTNLSQFENKLRELLGLD